MYAFEIQQSAENVPFLNLLANELLHGGNEQLGPQELFSLSIPSCPTLPLVLAKGPVPWVSNIPNPLWLNYAEQSGVEGRFLQMLYDPWGWGEIKSG